MSRFLLYLARWQLSTPILWIVVSMLGTSLEATILANLIGGSTFFAVDKLIFRNRVFLEWETRPWGECSDCTTTGPVRRLVLASGKYDRRKDLQPQFRCPICSETKLKQLIASGRVLT